jgi:hypothetical protein
MIDVRCRAVPLQSASKVGPVIARVGERIGLCVGIERIVGERRFHMFKRDSTLEAKLRGSPGEGCDCDRVIEDIMKPPQMLWLWHYVEPGFD